MARKPKRLEGLVDQVEARQPNGTPLDYLTESVLVAQDLQDQADELVGHFVELAREAGASWTEVGDALGVSKQAAQKRFVDPRRGGRGRRSLFMKFAPRARSVVVAAQESARERGDDHIGTEHLALALTGSRETYAGECLESMGVTSERLTELLGPGAGKPVSGHIPFTADAKKVLELALREAIRGEARRIDTEHLLLALLRDKDSAGARALAQLGATPAQVESWLDGNAA